MDILLWILQAILAIKCLSTALIHGVQQEKDSMRQARQRLGAVSRFILPAAAVLLLLCALGLILPQALGFLPWLTPLSAAVLAVMLLISIPLHIQSRDKPMIFVSVILFAFSAIVVFGRWY
jgi:uncharacterized membrane protein YphA (DoxX/SURF4 family)